MEGGRREGREETEDKQNDEQQTTGKDAPSKEKRKKAQTTRGFIVLALWPSCHWEEKRRVWCGC